MNEWTPCKQVSENQTTSDRNFIPDLIGKPRGRYLVTCKTHTGRTVTWMVNVSDGMIAERLPGVVTAWMNCPEPYKDKPEPYQN